MFDNISFETTTADASMIFHDTILSVSNFTVSDLIQFSNLSDENLRERYYLLAQTKELACRMIGTIKSFHIPPISQYTKEHLSYLRDFAYFELNNGSYTTRSNYPCYMILYTYQGYGQFEYRGKTYHLGEGDGFFIDGRLPHHYHCAGDTWVHSALVVQGPELAQLYAQFAANERPIFTQPINGNLQNNLEKILQLYSVAQPYRDWQISVLLNDMLTHLLVSSVEDSGRNIAMPKNLQFLIHYIENNYNKPLTLEHLSTFSGISRSHLSREFKKYTGYAPSEYIIQLRLDAARKLLGSTNMTAAAIALETGFHNMNNFINLFKKDTGMTPGAYRKQILNGPPVQAVSSTEIT